jgi:hypothetical protein
VTTIVERDQINAVQDEELADAAWERAVLAAISAGADFERADEIAIRVREKFLQLRRARFAEVRRLVDESNKARQSET